jgi:GGDEF domain-containing protein
MLAALAVASVQGLGPRPDHAGSDATQVLLSRWAGAVPPASLELLEVALQRAAVALILLDASHRVAWVNGAASNLVDRSPGELIDVRPDFLVESSADESADRAEGVEVWTPRPDPNGWRECRLMRRDGIEVPVLVHSAAVYKSDGRASSYLLQLVDPDRTPLADSADATALLTDPLTGLPTPLLLMDRLHTALIRSERAGSSVAVVRLRFQLEGDEDSHIGQLNPILVAAARRLRAALRATDTVACAGRDGFTLICEDISASQVRFVADRVVEKMGTTFNIDGHRTPVTVRSGVAVGKGPLTTSSRLLDEAEAALQAATPSAPGM